MTDKEYRKIEPRIWLSPKLLYQLQGRRRQTQYECWKNKITINSSIRKNYLMERN